MKNIIFLIAIVSFTLVACKETKVVSVKSVLVDCDGVGARKCMQYKEKGDDQWKLFYGNIEGFVYEEGYLYELEIDIEKIKNPPADGSSLKYTLSKLIKKEKDLAMNKVEFVNDKVLALDQVQENPLIVYSALTRGSFFEVRIFEKHIAIYRQRGEEPTIIKVAEKNLNELLEIINTINLEAIDKLKSPTEKRFYDGAAHAHVVIRKDEENFKSATFDHGFPPKELETLINKVLSLSAEK